ncbi:MAG TPA: UDP-N-acetylglucosamine 1-carboxyvinyltransferase [Terriglobia bacterium]|nr:UDP-N-acetylglucosamine 1-carboxyvinyltransferase [Terriglobia bacterium]
MSEKIYSIEGGKPIQGTVVVGGAKNAISKQLVASLLTDRPCVFTNVPRITEIETLLDMLSEIGTQYEWLDQNTLGIQTPVIVNATVSQKHSGVNRIPILLLAPLLHRAGEVTVPVVGGCRIGARPVDFHIEALRAMGAEIEYGSERYVARCSRLRGKTIHLTFPSVGATETAIIAGVLAEGTTVIANAAVEPEITDTILFLQKMGALIRVDVDRRIIIEGVKRLDGATHHTITDRIEAASFASAAVASNGRVHVVNAQQEHMITFLNEIRRIGGGFTVEKDGISFFRYQPQLTATHVETDVHPGFMTDWQQPFVILLTQAHGVSIIHETVYEDRFGYTRELSPMGANIDVTRACLGRKPCRFADQDHYHSCVVRGPSRLKGQDMVIPDLRAGFANVIAALVADGVSNIRGVRYIERGYAQVADKLASIGAAIQVIETKPVA